MKAYKGSESAAPLISELSSRWKWVIKFKTRSLYFRERKAVAIEQEDEWGSEPLRSVLQKRKSFIPAETRTPNRTAPSAQLYRLFFPAQNIKPC